MLRFQTRVVAALLLAGLSGLPGCNRATGPATGGARYAELTEEDGSHSVSLTGGEFTVDVLERLVANNKLTALIIQNSERLWPDALEQLDRLSGLESLSIVDADMTDDQLRWIAAIPKLRHLLLVRTGVDGSGLEHLAAAPMLVKLEFFEPYLTEDGLASLGAIRSLEEIDLRCQTAPLANIVELEQLRALRVWSSRGTPTGARGIERLSSLTSLEVLNCDPQGLVGEELVGLAELPNLRTLDLGDAAITDEHLRLIAQCPQLERLSLDGCTLLTDEGLANLQGLDRLRVLSLMHTRLTGAGIPHLIPLPALEQVEFSVDNITVDRSVLADFREQRPDCVIFLSEG